jgi:ADP-L-glycero-D-manno-heptose 6-epimerase
MGARAVAWVFQSVAMTAPIIVTGGCGFIGSHVVRALRERGDDVVIFERQGCWDFVECCPDVPKAVIHLGAVTSTTETDVALVLESNQLLSAKVWKYCRDNGVPLIYASSASVYGCGLRGFSECLPLDMNLPLGLYADSKRWFDNYILHQCPQTSPPRWHGLRLFNVYGDGEQHKQAQQSVVSKWIRSALAGGPIELFEGSQEFRRDFVLVDDVVRVILWALDNQPPNGIYNVGTGETATFAEAADAVRWGLNDVGRYGRKPTTIPMPDNVAAHYQKRTKANIAKLRTAGYDAPFLDIFEGARLTAQRIAGAQ